MAIWYTYFVVIWYIFLHFGTLHLEKSGNLVRRKEDVTAEVEEAGYKSRPQSETWLQLLGRVARWYIFKTQNPYSGIVSSVLEWERLVYSTNGHLEYFRPFGTLVAIWYIFTRFGALCQEKSGNPGFR
jgi:hypothetical protein